MTTKKKFTYWLIAIWVAFGLYQLAVKYFSPESNIRVDLLLLLPVLGIFSIYFIYKILKS